MRVHLLFVSYYVCTVIQAKTDGDSPSIVECPKVDLIREAKNELCPEEREYILEKQNYCSSIFKDFFCSLESVAFDTVLSNALIEKPPIMALAVSGGGYRSMLTATGFIKEMDRYGLFEGLSYISGLSGGSWILMDLILQDFNVSSLLTNWKLDDGLLKGIPDFDIHQKDLVSGVNEGDRDLVRRMTTQNDIPKQSFDDFEEALQLASLWFGEKDDRPHVSKRTIGPFTKVMDFFLRKEHDYEEEDKKIIQGDSDDVEDSFFGSIQSLHKIIQFYIDLHLGIRSKKMQGFTVSFTDYLGKAFKKRLKNNDIQSSSSFSQLFSNSTNVRQFKAPIPIFISNCRNGQLKNVIFEFNPFEFGSWEPKLNLFIKMPFLGSTIEAGKCSRCVKGYDDIGFITATSSSIFNNVLIYIWQLTAQSSRETIKAIKNIMGIFGLGNDNFDEANLQPSALNNLDADYAVYQPNPFYNYPGIKNELTQNDYLYLVDGGEDGENIPLRPLTIPQRKIDIIFALDSSSDKSNYPEGSKLLNVLNQLQKESTYSEHYSIPDFNKVKRYPIALGCDQSTLPIILYHPNAPHSYNSNTSTFKIAYNESELNGMIKNGRDIFSLGSNQKHIDCLSCFMAKKRIHQDEESRMPKFCLTCFAEYCR